VPHTLGRSKEETMSRDGTQARIWYQSFTDPDVDAPYFKRLSEYISSLMSPGYEAVSHGIQPGDRYLHPITEFRCSGRVIANAIRAEEEGYAAFVIGHVQEPALREARAAVSIPVIGLGEATMLFACTLGRKAGLVTINPIFIPYHDDQIARHGLAERVVAVRAVKAQVADYNRAFEDEETYRRMRDDFAEQVRPMLDLGVDVIIPAGGYPMLLFGREDGFAIEGATVLNGIPVTMAAAETAVRLQRLNGTGTSRCAAYALPVPEAVAEFKSFFG
jgi:allantoin racemase